MQLRMRPSSVLSTDCYSQVARMVTDTLEEVSIEELFSAAQSCGSEDHQGGEAPSPVVEDRPVDNVGQAEVSAASVGLPNEGEDTVPDRDQTVPEASDTHEVLEPVAHDAEPSDDGLAGDIPLLAVEVY